MPEFSDNIAMAAKAAERYEKLGYSLPHKRTTLLMDLMAADGVNGNAHIDWQKMLDAPATDFVHDVSGIQRHINRATGVLEDCFLPRCAAPE